MLIFCCHMLVWFYLGESRIFHSSVQFSSLQSLSFVRLFATPCTAPHLASLSITKFQSLLKLMSITLVMPSNHLILCWLLLLLPSIFSSIRVFSEESLFSAGGQSIGVSASHQSFQWILRSDSFRMGWLDLLAIRGTLRSLIQHHSSKTSILQHSAFFIIQLSHPYMTTGKTTALTRQTFIGKVMSLLFNMLSSLVIAFLPRSKHL